MIVKLLPAAGARLTVVTRDGKKLDNAQVASIEITPLFFTAVSSADVLMGTVLTASDADVDKFSLTVSGATGKVTRRDRNDNGVIPAIDKPKSKKPAGEPPKDVT